MVVALAACATPGPSVSEELDALVDTASYEQLAEDLGTPTERIDGGHVYIVTWREVEPGSRNRFVVPCNPTAGGAPCMERLWLEDDPQAGGPHGWELTLTFDSETDLLAAWDLLEW
jgi:hypothetical protein